jgi:P4 family phage/plasmid primase-like protien
METTNSTEGGQSSRGAAEIQRFWRHLFGGQTGLLQVWTGIRAEDGTIPDSTIRQNPFNYPKAAQQAAEWALQKAQEEDREVYFCAHLLTQHTRKKENAAEVITLWGELDGVPPPNGKLTPTTSVESSPGHFHLYWRLTDPVPPKVAEDLNKRLAQTIGADPSGFDLSQLLRVPFTPNNKYPDRPIVQLKYVDGEKVYSPAELDKILPKIEEPKAAHPPEDSEESPVALGDEAGKVWLGEKPKLKDNGEIDRSASLLNIGRVIYDAGANRRVVVHALEERDRSLGWRKYTDNRDGGQREYERIYEKLQEEGRTKRKTFSVGGRKNDGNDSNANSQQDDSNSGTPTHDELRDEWLAENPEIRYGLGSWRIFEDGHYKTIDEAEVRNSVTNTCVSAKDRGIRPSLSIVKSVLGLAHAKCYIRDEQWDSGPDILPCRNGLIHIPSRELIPSSYTSYVTAAVPYDYDPDADCPVFQQYLSSRISEASEFLQEFAGYSLTHDVSHDIAVWLQGKPGSGKSTFILALTAMLGPLSGPLTLSQLETSQFALSMLVGKTLVTSGEQPGKRLTDDGSLLNAIISGDPIEVNEKYKPQYTYKPKAKILWSMNSLPRIADPNSGVFRRIRIVKFPPLPEEEVDPSVRGKVQDEAPGILNWALDGLERLQQRGHFEPPACVTSATQEFKDTNDIPKMFLEERCYLSPDVEAQADTLYSCYAEWCKDRNQFAIPHNKMKAEWERLGLKWKRKNTGVYWQGVSLHKPRRGV